MSKFLFALLVTSSAGYSPVPPDHPIQPQRPPLSQRADTWSPRCATPAGICYVAPLPLGSPCKCGDAAGTIVP